LHITIIVDEFFVPLIIGFKIHKNIIFKNLILFSQIFLSSIILLITESVIDFLVQKLKKALEYLLDDGCNFIVLI